MDGTVIVLLKWEKTRALSHWLSRKNDRFRQPLRLWGEVRWGEMLYPPWSKCQQHWTPAKGPKETVQRGYLPSVNTQWKIREGTVGEESNKEKKSNSKCYMVSSISSRTPLWPPARLGAPAGMQFANPLVWLTSAYSPAELPACLTLHLSSWLVWLVAWRSTCLLYFRWLRCNSKPIWMHRDYFMTTCCLTVSVTFSDNIVKWQWQFWC